MSSLAARPGSSAHKLILAIWFVGCLRFLDCRIRGTHAAARSTRDRGVDVRPRTGNASRGAGQGGSSEKGASPLRAEARQRGSIPLRSAISFAGSSAARAPGRAVVRGTGGRWFESIPASWETGSNSVRKEPFSLPAGVAQLPERQARPEGRRFKSSPRLHGQVAQLVRAAGASAPAGRRFESSPAHQNWCRKETWERSSVGQSAGFNGPRCAGSNPVVPSSSASTLGRASRRNDPRLAGSIPVRCANLLRFEGVQARMFAIPRRIP